MPHTFRTYCVSCLMTDGAHTWSHTLSVRRAPSADAAIGHAVTYALKEKPHLHVASVIYEVLDDRQGEEQGSS